MIKKKRKKIESMKQNELNHTTSSKAQHDRTLIARIGDQETLRQAHVLKAGNL